MARTKDFDENEVLTKAMNLFWDKGYNGTSMQDLVDGLGISRSSLYDTYTDKHTLYIKSLEHYKKNALGNLAAVLHDSPSAKETIWRLLGYFVNELTKDAERKGCFLVNSAIELASHDQQINQMLCENDRLIEDLLRDTIEKGQQSGEITTQQNAASISAFISNNIKGMRVTARSATDKKAFEGIVNMVMAVLD